MGRGASTKRPHRCETAEAKEYPKAMTIALGILTGPAMVLAADTELSTSESKTSAPKIMWTKHLPVAGDAADAFGITGSGPVAYLEAIYQEMVKIFDNNRSFGMDQLDVSFQACLDQFYEAHVIPFSYCADRPDFWVIMAAERSSKRRMWVSDRNVLRSVSGCNAVGVGECRPERCSIALICQLMLKRLRF